MLTKTILHEFSNIGFAEKNRSFPGFLMKSEANRQVIAPRQALQFKLQIGDVISVRDMGRGQSVALYVTDAKGKSCPEMLGLKSVTDISTDVFDSEELLAWQNKNGGKAMESLPVTMPVSMIEFDALPADDDALILKAKGVCTLWVIRPMTAENLVSHASIGLIEVLHKQANQKELQLPPPLGEIRDEFTINRATAEAYQVNAGEIIQIIDVEGQQCSDFMALRRAPLDNGIEMMIDSTATRSMVRGAYPAPGLLDKFFDAELKPLMNVLQDTCGRHDTFGLACNARGYEERGFPGHVNCSDNISNALAPHGVQKRFAWPAINFFWNTWIDANSHQLMSEESYSRAGDYVAIRALDDLVCVSTACPDDIDPINGWNPTDIHVRIYRPDAPIRVAIAYREKENAPMSITNHSAFHPATSKLTTQFAPARDLWLPTNFPTYGTIGEYWACREKVTLQDMSSLRKYDIIGPDAEKLLQYVMSRDIARLAVWRGTYALICDETGTVVDDGTLFRLAPDLFRWCCGSEESARILENIAQSQNMQVRIHGMGGALPNLALQGPKSRLLLQKLVFTQPTVPSLANLKWFGVTIARLNDRDGIPFMLSRSGYTGELGYELFCAISDAPALWDALMEAGEEFGIVPMGLHALDMIRIEAGLAAGNAEFADGVDAFEAGLGFAVNLNKADFLGKKALERNAQHPRKVLKGLMFDCNDLPIHGAHVFAGERMVGVITSATRSPIFECVIAMARLAVEFSANDMMLEVGQMDGHMKRISAHVCDIPFHDPKREKPRM